MNRFLVAVTFGASFLTSSLEASTRCWNVTATAIQCDTKSASTVPSIAASVPPFMLVPAIPWVPAPVGPAPPFPAARAWPPSIPRAAEPAKPYAPMYWNGVHVGPSPNGQWLSVIGKIPTVRVIR